LKPLLLHITCGLLLSLFLYTAVSKINEFESFKLVLRKSPLIGNKNIIVANAVVLSEIVISTFLFMPSTQKAGLWGAIVLLTAFTFYICYMLLFAPYLPCACGGVINKMNWTQHVFFNLFFLLLSIAGLRFEKINRRNNFYHDKKG
jgi:putative oxidoreductase